MFPCLIQTLLLLSLYTLYIKTLLFPKLQPVIHFKTLPGETTLFSFVFPPPWREETMKIFAGRSSPTPPCKTTYLFPPKTIVFESMAPMFLLTLIFKALILFKTLALHKDIPQPNPFHKLPNEAMNAASRILLVD